MTYLLLLLAVPLCLFAPITIMFVVDEICLLCKVDDDIILSTIVNGFTLLIIHLQNYVFEIDMNNDVIARMKAIKV